MDYNKPLRLRQDISFGLYDLESENPLLAIDLLYARRFILFEDDAARVLGRLIKGKTISEILKEIIALNGDKGEEYAAETNGFLQSTVPLLFNVSEKGDDSFVSTQAPENDGTFVYDSFDVGRLYQAVCELTCSCQLHCVHCYNPDHQTKSDLSTAEWLSIISQLRGAGVFRVTLTGGDPFMREDIWEILEHIRSLSMSFDILTNGQYLADRKNAERLNKLYPHSVQCSVYSTKPEVHDRITGVPGSFNNVYKTLRYFQEYNVPTALKSPMLIYNYQDLAEINRLANELNATHQADINITSKIDGNTSTLQTRLSKDKMKELLLNEDGPLYNGIRKLALGEIILKKDSDPLCGAGRSGIAISRDGMVSPCLSFPLQLGNITKTPVADILNGEKMKKWLGICWGDRKGKCVECSISNFCSFCPGDAFLEKGDFLQDSKNDCEIAEARKEAVNALKLL